MDVLKRMPWLAQEAVFQKLASVADVASLTKKERMEYDENLRIYRDTIAVMESQYQEGMEKGIQTVARSMRDNHVPIDQIVTYTGLTAEEIARL